MTKEQRIKKLKDKMSELESKLFDVKLEENEKWNNIGFGHGMRHSKIVFSTKKSDRIKKRIEDIENKIKELENQDE